MKDYVLYFILIPIGLFVVGYLLVKVLLHASDRNPKLERKLMKSIDWIKEVAPNRKQEEFLVLIGIVLFFWWMF